SQLSSRRRGKATERARDYKVWTKEEDKVFIYNLQKLAREKYIENGSFHPGGYKELERLMNIDVPGCNIKVDPHIKSRFHWWKYKFVAQNYLRNSSGSGWDDARGCVSMEELKFAEWLTNTRRLGESGYDIQATGLKEAEAQSSTQAKGKSSTASSGQKRTRQQANDGKMDKMTETIAETAHNIARMANTFCIHDDTTMRQKML
ncbi:hypothetical protein LINPERPRIM_LOCUS6517, partial [Linum perenne]